MSTFQVLRKILTGMPSRRKKQFWIILVLMVFQALFEAITLGLIGLFVTSITSPENILDSKYFQMLGQFVELQFLESNANLVLFFSVVVAVMVIIKNSYTALIRYISARFRSKVHGWYGHQLLDGILRAPYTWFLTQRPGALIQAVDWREHLGVFLNLILQIINNSLLILVLMVTVILVQPGVILLLFSILGLTAWIVMKIMRRQVDKRSKLVRKYKQTAFLENRMAINGLKDVRIHNKERYYSNSFKEKVFSLSGHVGIQILFTQLPALILEAIGFTLLSLVIFLMLYGMNADQGEIFLTISILAVAAWRILPSLNKLLSELTRIRTLIPYLDTFFGYLDKVKGFKEQRRIDAKSDSQDKKDGFLSDLSLDNVCFRYEGADKNSLDNISLKIERGQSVGIIGHSGAGKSTLVDLIVGLLQPRSGEVFLDGAKMSAASWKLWRDRIGYVSQFPFIFDGTVAQNIAYTLDVNSIDREKILEVCKKASVDFINQLPEGIDSPLGENGVRVSGGQSQRIAIARALYQNPEVIIFDEATSSLDEENERAIQKTVNKLKGDLTLIIIAHRLTTVENCDLILWLEDGQTVDMAGPEKILPRYRNRKTVHNEEE